MTGLRAQAEIDLGMIMEDDTGGFGYPITLTTPGGTVCNMIGLSDDISQSINAETGEIVSGRQASIALRTSTIDSKGIDRPVGVIDGSKKPWLVAFDDINGNTATFKIMQTWPDRALGLIVCILEGYTA